MTGIDGVMADIGGGTLKAGIDGVMADIGKALWRIESQRRRKENQRQHLDWQHPWRI